MPSYSEDIIQGMVNFKKLSAFGKELIKEGRIKEAGIIDIAINDIFNRLITQGVKYTDIFVLDSESGKFYYPCAVCKGDFARPNIKAKSYTKEVITKIRKLELPLVPCRSKSGGMHIFMFIPDGIKASEMKQKLKECALSIGYPGSEIFPKQTEIRSDRGDTGNWLNLPYGIGMRYAFNDDGSAASLQEFFQLYDKYKLTKEQFNSLTIKDPDEILAGGPPCLNAILAKGSVGKGERNNTMFNICVYFIKTKKENWENEVSKVNEEYFKPKLEHTELNNIIASAKEKDKEYKVSDADRTKMSQLLFAKRAKKHWKK